VAKLLFLNSFTKVVYFAFISMESGKLELKKLFGDDQLQIVDCETYATRQKPNGVAIGLYLNRHGGG
jgi:hypothetical protein